MTIWGKLGVIMSKLKKFGTRFPGVRYYEHHERKHKGKPDRYFSIRYMMHNKQKEEGLGWASQGMTDSQASEILAEFRKANRIGEGFFSLKQKRAHRRGALLKQFRDKLRKIRDNRTFNDI